MMLLGMIVDEETRIRERDAVDKSMRDGGEDEDEAEVK